jgi:hypothetical protein
VSTVIEKKKRKIFQRSCPRVLNRSKFLANSESCMLINIIKVFFVAFSSSLEFQKPLEAEGKKCVSCSVNKSASYLWS